MMLTASILKAFLTLCIWYFMNINNLRKGGRFSWRQIFALWGLLCLFQVLVCFGIERLFGTSLFWLNIQCCIFLLPLSWLPFYNYRGQGYQNLFMFFTTAMFATVTQGMGNAAEVYLLLHYAPGFARLGNFLASLLTVVIVFPPLYVLLRRLFATWQGPQAQGMWRAFWLIPMAYFVLSLVSANFSQPESLLTFGFLLSRIVVCLTMFVLLYIMTAVLQQGAHTAEMAERSRLVDQQLSLQRSQYDLLSRNIEESRAARHDLRHHLTVMQGYLDGDDLGGLVGFVDQALQALPAPQELQYCENWAVNALLRHYLDIAAQEDFSTDMLLYLPDSLGRIRDTDLCVVIGNCLENALEAGRLLPEGQRQIHMRTLLRGPYLAILIDNLFDGEVNRQQGDFYSRKHAGVGIGLTSVQAVARQYDGVAAFWPYGTLFHSMVLLRLEAPRGASRSPASIPKGNHGRNPAS